MKTSKLRFAAAMLLSTAALPGAAQDEVRGRQLYETHCGGCHYERVHQRERARQQVKSLSGLRLEVVRWAAQVKRPLAPEDLDDIVAYLNRSHYRFEK